MRKIMRVRKCNWRTWCTKMAESTLFRWWGHNGK